MISILLTSYKEPKTIGRAIQSLSNQGIKDFELLVSAPDKETLDVARQQSKYNEKIKVFQDKGIGKPAALNMLFKKAKGDILILSDGDVLVSKGAVKFLVEKFKDKKVGAVSGRVLSANDPNTMFGYWADMLTKGFDVYRKRENKKVLCSGYLYAIRAGIVKSMPKDILVDDAYVSLEIINKGYISTYEPKATVSVKYPTNLSDWVIQKQRTASRSYQLKKYFNVSKSKSFKEEILSGLSVLKEIKSVKQAFWFLFLSVMKIYIWMKVFFDFRLWNQSFKKTWKRVESTKN
ncbi:MAG TPA: glycosyltransferase [Candidatus Nanoarchaeia archaeon]|nr:glycosyltransferase [Candidatus Nanoarchaeia archaeon]